MARELRAPKSTPRLRSAGDLLLVFGVVAFALGLTAVAAGISVETAGALPAASRTTLAAGPERSTLMRQDGNVNLPSAQPPWRGTIRQEPPRLAITTDRLSTQLSVQAPAGSGGQRDRRQALAQAAAQARRSRTWVETRQECDPYLCSLSNPMAGD